VFEILELCREVNEEEERKLWKVDSTLMRENSKNQRLQSYKMGM